MIVILGADGLRRILDDRNLMAHAGVDDRHQLCRLTEQMHRHNGTRPRRDGRDSGLRIDVERVGFDVHEHGLRAQARHTSRRREEGIGAGDDLVAGADADRHQCGQNGVGARRHPDGVMHAEVRFELALEPLHLGAVDESLRVANPRQRIENLGTQRVVLRL